MTFGVSNGAHNIVDDISVSEPEDIAAKNDSLDATETLEIASIVLLGVGAACGAVSFIFGRMARRKEDRGDEFEDGLLLQ